MPGNKNKTECDRCGTCCIEGGPALHQEDSPLLQNNFLNPAHLITVRTGEPVFSPSAGNPEPAQSEIIKIKGRGIEWTCLFFQEEDATCAIYEHRPLECSLLKCWETADLEKVAGLNLLSRYDIIAPQDPVLPFIRTHNEQCSLEELALILSAVKSENSQSQAVDDLTRLVNADMAIRAQAWAKLHFSLDLELFFFGRPLFIILGQFGIEAHEKNSVWRLSLSSSPSSARLANT